MTGFLVVGRCADVDVPMGLFAGEDAARRFAGVQSEESVKAAVLAVYGHRVGRPVNVSIVPFLDGVPGKAVHVAELSEVFA